MKVKCVICDRIESLEDDSFEAKRLRNRRIYTYLCRECTFRIAEKTKERHATGNFHLYETKKDKEDLI